MKLVALTQGKNTPSSRFRIQQIISPLKRFDIDITEITAIPSSYPPEGFGNRIKWAAKVVPNAFERYKATKKYEICILQRELVSTIPTFEIFINKPIISDIDDSIWMRKGGLVAAIIARKSSHIIVGNNYLANYFSKYKKPISIIPTAVDVERFKPRTHEINTCKILGWSGTWGGYIYFEKIQEAIMDCLQKNPDWKFRFVSDRPPRLSKITGNQIEYIPWSAENEAELISQMDIGLMPINDSQWDRGKCSYKMLLYMASGIPVIASDFGMNQEVISMGKVGMPAKTPEDWHAAIMTLMGNDGLRHQLGKNGRRLVQDNFSLEVVSKMWYQVLQTFR